MRHSKALLCVLSVAAMVVLLQLSNTHEFIVDESRPTILMNTPTLTDSITEAGVATPATIPARRDLLIPEIPLPQGGTRDNRKWLVVIGILSTDTFVGSQRRDSQRRSWHKYPNVYSPPSLAAALEDDSRRVVLVRYVLGLHPSNKYRLSANLTEEANLNHDIVGFDMKEGMPTTAKTSGGGGYWGLEAEVGMSRKSYAWYCFAAATYDTHFIMKSDDDFFLRTMQYVADLLTFPRQQLYWGKVMKWSAKKGGPLFHISFCWWHGDHPLS